MSKLRESEPIEGGGVHEDVNKTAEEVVQSTPLNEEVKRDGLSDHMQPFKSNRKCTLIIGSVFACVNVCESNDFNFLCFLIQCSIRQPS